MFLYLFIFVAAAISCYECGSMYDGTNFMGIKGYDQCQFFESDVILGASGEEKEPDIRTKGGLPYIGRPRNFGIFYTPSASVSKKTDVQGDPSGQQLYFVVFDLGVQPCCLHAMPILPDLQLPKQSKAHIVTKSTKCSCQYDESPCTGSLQILGIFLPPLPLLCGGHI